MVKYLIIGTMVFVTLLLYACCVAAGEADRREEVKQMSRAIDADALLDEVMNRHCNDCDRRKGIKNGKYRIIYSIGDAPCRACDVDDLKGEIEDAPTIEPEYKEIDFVQQHKKLPVNLQLERKKGKWIDNHTTCSECGWQMIDDVIESPNMVGFNFCSNCGADMTEGKG